MIEITKNNLKTPIIGTKSVFIRNKYILKRYIGRSCCGRIGCLDWFGLNARTSLNEEDHHSTGLSTTANSEIISEDAVGDPFLNEEMKV